MTPSSQRDLRLPRPPILRGGQLLLLASVVFAAAVRAQDWFDRLGDALSFHSEGGTVRLQVSGRSELELYYTPEPVSDLMMSSDNLFWNPRMSLLLDAQVGEELYAFAQLRADRGFDPGAAKDGDLRLDEYALRYTPWVDGRFSVQAGQFATVVGNWTRRHAAWENPLITPPLPYDNLTAMWDGAPAPSARTLLAWGHVRPVSSGEAVAADKFQRVPIVWGASYASGFAISGGSSNFEYALELKNASLSSRPEVWNEHGRIWRHPTVSGRLGWRPNPTWRFGVSASHGTYLRPEAWATLPPGRRVSDYRQIVLAHDLAFAWRHVQLWAEVYFARFESPEVGNADTIAYYIEAKYKFTPQLYGAVRWNQQHFRRIADGRGGRVAWGRQVWRIDVAPTYRFTAHIQGKLQYSLRHEEPAVRELTHSLAAQLSVRF